MFAIGGRGRADSRQRVDRVTAPLLGSWPNEAPATRSTAIHEDSPQTPPPRSRLSHPPRVHRARRWRWALASLAVVLVIAAGASELTEGQLREAAAARAIGERRALEAALERLRHLPVAVAAHPDVVALLGAPDALGRAPPRAPRVDAYLARVADAADAGLLYVIDADGVTRAASNHRSPGSLVGRDYTFRPYFRDALTGGEGRHFAVGVTTGEAGYYFSRPVAGEAVTVGVAVVKIELEPIQRQWEGTDGTLLLVDEHGVTILASRPAWRFRTLDPVAETTRESLVEQRKYARHALVPLEGRRESAADGRLVRLALDGDDWLVTELPLASEGWRLLHLVDAAPVRRAGWLAALAALLVGGLGSAIYLYLRERRRQRTLHREAREAGRMRELNGRLETEIGERRRAESELRATQDELIQASRLAALGQLSAAIAHEVNQPLSAIRTFSASARLLIDRGRTADARANLEEIDALTARLATLTGELKVFARKPERTGDAGGAGVEIGTAATRRAEQPVDLARSIRLVAHHLETPLAEARTTLELELGDEAVFTLGSAARVEQVLSNLVVNAIDAARESDGPRSVHVSLLVDEATDEALVRVRDSGPGLTAEAMEHLFDPFFTTKPVGQGVGLGLAIAYGIVNEMGGKLRVRNVEDGGALFSLRFARYAIAATGPRDDVASLPRRDDAASARGRPAPTPPEEGVRA